MRSSLPGPAPLSSPCLGIAVPAAFLPFSRATSGRFSPKLCSWLPSRSPSSDAPFQLLPCSLLQHQCSPPHLCCRFKPLALPPATSGASFHHSEAPSPQQLPLPSIVPARGCWLETSLCPPLSFSTLSLTCHGASQQLYGGKNYLKFGLGCAQGRQNHRGG